MSPARPLDKAHPPAWHWPGWQHLPREARDTLFLLGVIGWTALPHLLHLPLWCTMLTVIVLLWRARLALTQAPLPGRWTLVAVLVVAVGLTQFSFGTLFGKESGISLVLVLMAMKTLELRARRDAFVVFFLGFFLVLTHFLYSQSIGVAAAMLVSVWGLLTALVLAHMPVGRPSLRQAAGVAGRTAALGTPVMVLLFMMFPRIGPLWGVPQDVAAGSGLSNSMSMGTVAQLALDERVAMRVKFLDAAPSPEDLYFRGPVLSRFDGNEWFPLTTEFPAPATRDLLRPEGEPIRYEVTLEAPRMPVLPLLEATPALPQIDGLATRRREELTWATSRSVTERLRFTAVAYPRFTLGPLDGAEAPQAEHLALPEGFNPRMLAWADELRRAQPQADATALANAVLGHIRTGGYSYTLNPGLYGDENPRGALDEFWMDRKAGFCEHFSSGFVVAMRALKVPARVVTGFQGADPVQQDGYHLVRNSHAHAWAEYWQAGRGWVRTDPTAAVSPDRVTRSRNLLQPRGAVAGALDNVDPRLLAGLRSLWETVDNRWNQWVLNYARGQQLELLQRLGMQSPSWEDLARLLVGVLVTLSLAGAAWAWWDRRSKDPWQRQAQALSRQLRRLGLRAAPFETPRELAAQLRQRFAEDGNALAALLMSLERQRYGPQAPARPSKPWWREVKAEAHRLRKRPRRAA